MFHDEFEVISTVSDNPDYSLLSVVQRASNIEFLLKFNKSNESDLLKTGKKNSKENEIFNYIEHPRIARRLLHNSIRNVEYFLFPYEKVYTLQSYISSTGSLGLSDCVKIGIQLLDVLDLLHRRGIIYCNFDPERLYISEDKGICIYDFGPSITDIDLITIDETKIIGSYPYISPEQTGFPAFKPDSRSDLYCIGLLLYRLITGKLPFNSNSASVGDLIDAMLKHELKPLKTVPSFFNEVFIKSMRASPDDRYQTAAGFKNDLNIVLSILRREMSDISRRPGDLDAILDFKRNHPFITRDNELEVLQNSLKSLQSGKSDTVLLFGNSGIGKTTIARHFIRLCKQKKIAPLIVKCNRFTPNQPYSVYKGLIVKYLSDFNEYMVEKKTELISEVTTTLNMYAGIICSIIPEMQSIFGEIKISEISEKEKESDRINGALLSLLEIVCKLRPTLIFIDDFQWIDFTSFQILLNLKEQSVPFLSLFTYRVDNTELKHGIHRKNFDQIADRVLHVQPFTSDEIKWYLQKLFNEISGEGELVEVIENKTSGNPFNIHELVCFLVENQFIEKKESMWVFNVSMKDQLPKRYDACSLILSKIESLENNEKILLQTGSLFDGKIDKDILAKVIGYEQKQISRIFKKLEIRGFLQANFKDEFNFVHDKVQEAIYSSMEISKRKQLYEKIGAEFEARIEDNKEYFFNAAEAYLKSSNLNKAIELSYKAGHFAHNKSALNLASRHFRNCLILTEQLMRFDGQVTTSIEEIEYSLGKIFMLSGKNEQALKIFFKLRDQKSNIRDLERLELEYKIGCIYINMGDFSMSREHFFNVLSEIGIKMPIQKVSVFMIIVNYIFTKATLLFVKKLKPGPGLQLEILKLNILNKLSYSLYFDDMISCLAPHLKALAITEKIPDCYEKVETYAMHMVTSLQMFMKKRAKRYIDKIDKIEKKLKIKEITVLAESYKGFFCYYSGNWNDATAHLQAAIREYCLTGDIPNQIVCQEHIWRIAYMRGEFINALQSMQTTLNMCRQSREKHFLISTKAAQAVALYITQNKKPLQSDLQVNNSSNAKTPFLTKTHVNILQLDYKIQNNEFEEAYALSTEIIPLILRNGFNAEYDVPAFSLRCELIVKELCNRKKGLRQIGSASRTLMLQLLINVIFLFFISRNYSAHRGAFYRITALLSSLLAFKRVALFLFRKSIWYYHSLDMKYEEAKTYRDLGEFYNDLNSPGLARDYFDKAYLLFEVCNAVVEMDRLVNLVRAEVLRKKEHTIKLKTPILHESVNQIRFDTLIEVSNSIYELGDITTLMDQILSSLIKASGAQYGYIFVLEDNELSCRLALDFQGSKINCEENTHGRSIVEQAIDSRKIIVENSELANGDTTTEKARSILGVPLYHKNEVMGCVYLANDNITGLFSDNAVKTVHILSAQASILLENAFLMEKYKLLNRELDLKVKRQTRDIIDKNRQLENTNIRLVESERLKGILSGTLVHDIKNYAAGIEGNLQYLGRRISGDHKIKKVIDVVSETCLDIINLASNLLDIAKMDEGRLVVRPEIIEIDYIDGLLEKFASNPLFEDKGIVPVIKRPQTTFAIDADVYLLERVIQNIFSNAAKYVPAGGSVEVTFENSTAGNIICFYNSGTPIPERDKEILFEKYARIENRQTQYSKGLGLFFCKMVMNAHKGKVWVDSDESGNYFKLAFPRPLLLNHTGSTNG